MTRCVRRACLRGEGGLDRKEWIEHRLEELAQVFGHRAKAARSRGHGWTVLWPRDSPFPTIFHQHKRRTFGALPHKVSSGQWGSLGRYQRFSRHDASPFGEGLHGCQRGFGPCCRRRVFRPAGFHRRTGTSSITPATKLRTNPDSRFGPATADRGSRRIRDQPRNPPKSTEKRIRINSPFPCPSVLSVVTRL